MDEKASFVALPLERSLTKQRCLSFKLLITFFLALLALRQVFFPGPKLPYHADDSTLTDQVRVRQYEGETIAWHECGSSEHGLLECSEITVPMDQFNSTNSRDKTFRIPLIRSRGANATQNVILNPGGPGGSGIDFIRNDNERLRALVGENFHLLSFDPRGVAGSQPRVSCFPNNETRIRQMNVRHTRVIEDSGDIYAWFDNYARACHDTTGEHGGYINTPQTAADMNSILDAVGQKNIIYWGLSYGTVLGQTYATLFPERILRMIISGVVDIFGWYEDRLDRTTLLDAEHVLTGFFDECIKAKDQCPLSSYGNTTEQLQYKVLNLAETLEQNPISIYLNNTNYGTVSKETVLYNGIFSALYRPAKWHRLADNLVRLFEGNATEAFLAYGGDDPANDLERDDLHCVRSNDIPTGPKHWPQDRKGLLEIILPHMNHSIFGTAQMDQYYVAQKWRYTKTHDFVPQRHVQTANPLLIISTTYDPVCPLAAARVANDAFEGSQVIEVMGYGHGALANPSACMTRHFRAYLDNGTLPPGYTRCEVDGHVFSKPLQNEAQWH